MPKRGYEEGYKSGEGLFRWPDGSEYKAEKGKYSVFHPLLNSLHMMNAHCNAVCIKLNAFSLSFCLFPKQFAVGVLS